MSPSLKQFGLPVSSTIIQRDFAAKLKEIKNGTVAQLLILQDNKPAAVLMGVNTCLALLDELEDLRAELIAIERRAAFNEQSSLSLEVVEAGVK